VQAHALPLPFASGGRAALLGHANRYQSPNGFWCDLPGRKWVVVLKGAAQLEFEGGALEMTPGDFLDIPAHQKHRVAWTTSDEPTIWLAAHYGSEE